MFVGGKNENYFIFCSFYRFNCLYYFKNICLAYLNIDPEVGGTIGEILGYVAKYGGLVIILAFAGINFFGNPLKIAFFVLLVIAVILYILTVAIPGPIQSLFGLLK